MKPLYRSKYSSKFLYYLIYVNQVAWLSIINEQVIVSHYSSNEFSKGFFTTRIIHLWNISLLRYLNTFTSHCMFIKHAKFKQGEEKRKDIKNQKGKQKFNLNSLCHETSGERKGNSKTGHVGNNEVGILIAEKKPIWG